MLYDPAHPISESPPAEATRYIENIHSLLETHGVMAAQEDRERLAARLTADELHELADAFLGLYNAVAEAYYRQQSQG